MAVFEWDAWKNDENVRKHGFDFEDAPEIFDSPMLVLLDTREDYGEDRWIGIGILLGRTVTVVFTERDDGETVRIISLRKATRYERESYEETLSH
jgi:uncharacterized DUF497 family protein